MWFRRSIRQLILLVVTVATYCTFKVLLMTSEDVDLTPEEIETGNSHTPETATRLFPLYNASRPFFNQLGISTTEKVHARPEVRPTGAPLTTKTPVSEPTMLYNTNNCSRDYLGLTAYAAEICSNQSRDVCDSLTCRSLLTGTGNDLYYGVARKLMTGRPRRSEPDAFFLNATRNCDDFKNHRGYHVRPTSQEEADFPLAFNLLVHTKLDQVEGLLRAIYRPQNLYCIHVDAKASKEFIAGVRAICGCFENVFVAARLEVLTWGGYNRLQADINCMSEQVNRSVPWRYLINTAGLAYPLKTIEEMVKVLKIYNGANDIEGIYGSRVLKSRFEKEWVEIPSEGKVKSTGKKNPPPPHEIDIVRGSAYGIFSREFVEYILNDRRAVDLLEWSKKTWSPDELYWATLHHTHSNPQLRTPGGFSGYPSDKPWLAVWANWYPNSCHGRMVRGVCIFGVGDLPLLLEHREFFANKFYDDYEPLALECMAAWIRQKEICPPVFDSQYYRSLPFVKRPS